MDLHPDFPVVEGRYRMTEDWWIHLPLQFNRRVEEGSLVFWRPIPHRMTAWITVWAAMDDSAETRLETLKSGRSKNAFDIREDRREDVAYYRYRLREAAEDDRVPALYCFAVSVVGHVQAAFYFDSEADLALVDAMALSVTDKQRQ